MVLSSVLYEIRIKMASKLLPRESRMEYSDMIIDLFILNLYVVEKTSEKKTKVDFSLHNYFLKALILIVGASGGAGVLIMCVAVTILCFHRR